MYVSPIRRGSLSGQAKRPGLNFAVRRSVYDYAGALDNGLRLLTGGIVDLPDKLPGTGVSRRVSDAATFRLSIGNAVGEIGKVIDILEHELVARHVPPDLLHKAQTVADELVTNVIRHGYRDNRPHTIDVAVDVREDALTLQISDEGIPFNPFDRPAPDLTRAISERPAGGMGIHLVRQLASDCRYARVDGRNLVTVVLRQLPA